jgi:chaperonin GroES
MIRLLCPLLLCVCAQNLTAIPFVATLPVAGREGGPSLAGQPAESILRAPTFARALPKATQSEVDQMQLRPLYDRIVVRRIEQQEQKRGGIIIPDSAKEKPQEAEVVAVGRGKRLENGSLVPLDIKVGDRILFGKYSGSEVKMDGQEYLIMREDEVLGIIETAGAERKAA